MNIERILATIRTDLINRFSHEIPEHTIGELFDSIAERHLATAEMLELLPVLVEREVTERLESMLTKAGRGPASRRLQILFVSRENPTLASAAVQYARDLAGVRVLAEPAPDQDEVVADDTLVKVLDARGVDLAALKEEILSSRMVNIADVVVYLGKDEIRDQGGRHDLVWDIESTDGKSELGVSMILDDVNNRIFETLSTLGITDEANAAVA